MIPRTTIDPGLITTAFDLPGHKVVRSLGVVRGIIVRSRSVVGTIGASIQTLFGGNITLFTQLCERTRAEAFSLMASHPSNSAPTVSSAFASIRPMSCPVSPKCFATVRR